MAKYTFVVLTNPTSGKEAEYNKWYNDQHIPDVLNVPGFVAAQRFCRPFIRMYVSSTRQDLLVGLR